MEQEKLFNPAAEEYTIRVPKRVATIKLCGGAMTLYIDDTMHR